MRCFIVGKKKRETYYVFELMFKRETNQFYFDFVFLVCYFFYVVRDVVEWTPEPIAGLSNRVQKNAHIG